MKLHKKAFTLVELIVVMVILAILATIGFVGYSSYLSGARDSNRISQLKAISTALNVYSIKNLLPYPENKIEIRANINGEEKILAYQGYAGKKTLESIGYSESGIDPKNKTYFNYYLTENRRNFQLLAFLEEENTDVVAFSNNVNATDYTGRNFIVKGEKLGILVSSDTNTPLQEIDSLNSDMGGVGYLNIETTNDSYKAILENGFEIVGTGSTLKILKGTLLAGGVRNSCKKMLQKARELRGKDGYYLINQNSPTKVYCDMTTNGGGWTRYVKIKGNYTKQEARDCWLADKNTETINIECFNPNRLNFLVSDLMLIKEGGNKYFHKFKRAYPSQIERIPSTADNQFRCLGGIEYMTIAKSTTYPKLDASDTSRVWLGLNYCKTASDGDSAYEVGGKRTQNYSTTFMNGSKTGFGPNTPTTWQTTADKDEFYVR